MIPVLPIDKNQNDALLYGYSYLFHVFLKVPFVLFVFSFFLLLYSYGVNMFISDHNLFVLSGFGNSWVWEPETTERIVPGSGENGACCADTRVWYPDCSE